MKRIAIILSALLLTIITAPAKKQSEPEAPQWTKTKPAVPGYYVGIGSASVYSKDYQSTAKEKALADLTSDIEVKIANQSLLERLDDNGEYSEKYENNIRSESKAWLEGYELTDTYNDGERYYVQYRLNAMEYERIKKARAEKAAAIAADYWEKANTARQNGRFHDAVELLVTGIKTIEPFGNERLEVSVGGSTVNIGAELLYTLSGMFSKLVFRPSQSEVEVTPFQREIVPLKIRVLSDNLPVMGVKIKAKFSQGDGKITINGRTDDDGTTEITIRDLSTKPFRRELVVTAALDVESLFNTPATTELGKRVLASIQPLYIPINMAENNLKAALYTTDDNTSPLLKSLSSYFATNYFDMVDDERDADLKIIVSTTFHSGGTVSGQLYDMREYFTSCMVKILDLNAESRPEVIRVNLDEVRSLSPVSTSATAARTTAQREMFKRISKQLDRKLAEAKFEQKKHQTDLNTGEEDEDSGPFVPEEF